MSVSSFALLWPFLLIDIERPVSCSYNALHPFSAPAPSVLFINITAYIEEFMILSTLKNSKLLLFVKF